MTRKIFIPILILILALSCTDAIARRHKSSGSKGSKASTEQTQKKSKSKKEKSSKAGSADKSEKSKTGKKKYAYHRKSRKSSRSGYSLPEYTYDGEYRIVVDKPKLMLYVIEQNRDTVMAVRCCCGENIGQKMRGGDHKTPEGNFSVCMIEKSDDWDLNKKKHPDAKYGPYGPWFFRLRCPQSTHIGIHGTSNPASIGTRASEGCVRLHNSDLEHLRKYVELGIPVTILPDRP